jgi:hypothetical protein
MNLKTSQIKTKIFEILKSSYNEEISEKILNSFSEIQNNFRLEKWKSSEFDAGHFVEIVRRIIEFELFGRFTPFSESIENFNISVLQKYENTIGKHDSFRFLIPKILYGIYSIRNRRGVGHIGIISPNEMDASLILNSVKWVIAEIIRLKSDLEFDETKKIIGLIIEHEIPILWKYNSVRRILVTKMPTKEKVLVLLYDENPLKEKIIREAIEYKNLTNFKNKIIIPLHKERYIEYNQKNRICYLTTKGSMLAEKIIAGSNR